MVRLGGGEDRLTENVSLNFAEVKVEYKPQGSKSLGVEHIFSREETCVSRRSARLLQDALCHQAA